MNALELEVSLAFCQAQTPLSTPTLNNRRWVLAYTLNSLFNTISHLIVFKLNPNPTLQKPQDDQT